MSQRSELFVRGLPEQVTNEELAEFFSELAPVKHAVAVNDPVQGVCKGFGFVSFADAEDAAAAHAKAKSLVFKGRKLTVDIAKPRHRGGEKDETPEAKESKVVEKRRPRLIVRNLPWSVRDKDQLVKIFSKYGKVVDAIIPRKKGGKMSGFAFVTMRKQSSAQKAIEESKDLKIEGRPVAVDYAVTKEQWQQKTQEAEDDEESEENEIDSDEDHEEDVDETVKSADGDVDDEDDEEDEDEDDEDDDDEDDEEDEEDEEEAPKRRKLRPADNSFTIFVRNIPYDATSESLKEHFSQFGPVRYALPVMDKLLNQPKGTAFVAFYNEQDRNNCVENSPSANSSSLLIADDVDSRYVFEGRILSIAKAVEKDTAEKLATASAKQREVLLGKEPEKRDKRKLFLLNEGRIGPDSKLAQTMSAKELEIREESYKLRKRQVTDNPSLHLSMTRLAVRNIPRSMGERSLKQLARKAVVEFAREVSNGDRQPLTKEEIKRSIDCKKEDGLTTKSKKGVVRQVKIIKEEKHSGEMGRSRGYGFIEYRDHKSALMGLRWLNAHQVTVDEIKTGLSEAETEKMRLEKDPAGRRLVVEFALENAKVVKRRKENQMRTKAVTKKKAEEAKETAEAAAKEMAQKKAQEAEMNKGKNSVRNIIGKKRKFKKLKGKN